MIHRPTPCGIRAIPYGAGPRCPLARLGCRAHGLLGADQEQAVHEGHPGLAVGRKVPKLIPEALQAQNSRLSAP